MFELAVVSSVALVVFCVAHLVTAIYFVRVVLRRPRPPDEGWRPLVSVVLPVRGSDPTLERTVQHLLAQDYDRFEVIVVIDDREDPAWEVVERLKREHDHRNQLRVFELAARIASTCSPKCLALIQATSMVDSTCEVVALIDADVVPHQTWLADVVAPLGDPEVGVVTGQQWFEPEPPTPGSMLRSLWGAIALVPSAIRANPWAGTCAMRVADIRRAGLPEIWARSVVDDGPIRNAMRGLGLRCVFIPQLIMVNREVCSVAFVSQYVARVLTWSRLYEPAFRQTLAHVAVSSVLLASTLGLLCAAIVQDDRLAATAAVAGLLLSVAPLVAGYGVLRSGVTSVSGAQAARLEGQSLSRWALASAMIPASVMLYVWSTLRASCARSVTWRQVTYDVQDRDNVRVVAHTRLRPDR